MNFSHEIVGGILIGLASALPLIFDGRIAGVSGYAASSIKPKSEDQKTGFLFILGIVLASLAWKFIGFSLPQTPVQAFPIWMWAIAGLMVGFGSRLGGGCTSGHGVCGLGRGSPRSFVAVCVFMAAAMLSAFIVRISL